MKNKRELEYTPFLSLLCPWRLDGLRAGRPWLDSGHEQDVSLFYNAQTGSGAHPATDPMSTGGSFSGGKKPLQIIIFLYNSIIYFSNSFILIESRATPGISASNPYFILLQMLDNSSVRLEILN
jgi:hypothetical protein